MGFETDKTDLHFLQKKKKKEKHVFSTRGETL